MEFNDQKIPKPSDVCKILWKEIFKKVKNAVVYLDDFFAESLHWNVDFKKLLDSGAKDVKEFYFNIYDENSEKAVFIISTGIFGIVKDTLCKIIKLSKFKYVIVITATHPSVHKYAKFAERDIEENSVMLDIEKDILNWMGNMNYTAEIFYYPALLVQFSEDVFLLPKFSVIYPLLESDLSAINELILKYSKGELKVPSSLREIEFEHLPFRFRIAVRHFITCMHTFLQSMNAREEIYSLGHTSAIIASELESYNPARQRRKNASNKVSLVFIDRTLDLVSPISNNDDTLMSRILTILPRLHGHRIDSAVNMAPLSKIHPSCQYILLPGNFCHKDTENNRNILESSIYCHSKETISLANNKLAEVFDSLPDQEMCDSNEIDKIKKIAADRKLLENNFSLVQQCMAIIEVLKHPRKYHIDELYSMEKSFLQMIGDSYTPYIIREITELLIARNSKNVTLEDCLYFLIYVASLGGCHILTDSHEDSLTNAIAQALLEDKMKLSDSLQDIVGCEVDEISALQTARSIWKKLKSLANSRNTLKDYSEILFKHQTEAEPNSYKSLLSQLVKDCLNPPQYPLSDLEYKSTGFKDIIKTGFSLFVNVSKPRPRDCALMIIYVLGGITPSEIRDIKKLIHDSSSTCEVLIGSSHLTYPADALRKYLRNELLKPY